MIVKIVCRGNRLHIIESEIIIRRVLQAPDLVKISAEGQYVLHKLNKLYY